MSLLFRKQGVGTRLMTRYALRFLNTVSVTMLYSLQINIMESQLTLRVPRVPSMCPTRGLDLGLDRDDKLIAFLLVLFINFSVPSGTDGLENWPVLIVLP